MLVFGAGSLDPDQVPQLGAACLIDLLNLQFRYSISAEASAGATRTFD
jgi:hypothetical protein